MGANTASTNVIRVSIVDDEELVRSGIRMLLNYEPGIEVVAEGCDGDQLAAIIQDHPDLDIVLLDVRMHRVDGMTALRRLSINTATSRPRVLMLTTFESECHAADAIAAGACGFLLKDATSEELITAIRAAHEGNAVLAATTCHLLGRGRFHRTRGEQSLLVEQLTEREQQVVRAIATGATNTQIAKDLHISENTVKTHVGRILTKLRLHDRVQLVVAAYRSGLIE